MVPNQEGVSLYALDQYRREVKWIPPVTEEEEARLLQCIERAKGAAYTVRLDDDVCGEAQHALTRLVEGYQAMVLGIAVRYAPYCREIELLDLVQEGNLGLLQACEHYDGRKSGPSFGVWASSWIRGTIRCALFREGAIRLPLEKARAVRLMNKVNRALFATLGRDPSLEETAQEMGMTPRQVCKLVVLQEQKVVSLHTPIDEDGEVLLEEVIADSSASSFAEDGFSSVDDVLSSLTRQEREVMKLRYGLDDGHPRTQREVAELTGMKLSTVQMLDGRAKRRLRRALVA
jgi:RNA polymerase primary sigma factor